MPWGTFLYGMCAGATLVAGVFLLLVGVRLRPPDRSLIAGSTVGFVAAALNAAVAVSHASADGSGLFGSRTGPWQAVAVAVAYAVPLVFAVAVGGICLRVARSIVQERSELQLVEGLSRMSAVLALDLEPVASLRAVLEVAVEIIDVNGARLDFRLSPKAPPVSILVGDEPDGAGGVDVGLSSDGADVGRLRVTEGDHGRPGAQHEGVFTVVADRLGAAVHKAQLRQRWEDDAIEEERRRIARELHDSVSQRMYSVALLCAALPRSLDRDPQSARQSASQIREMTLASLAEMRGLLYELRPLALETTSLATLLAQLVDAADDRSAIVVRSEIQTGGNHSTETKLGCYRIAQEAVTNATRHSHASTVTVRLAASAEATLLEISDDGVGFDPTVTDYGHGIRNLNERAAMMGATLTIDSTRHRGTTVRLRYPAHGSSPAGDDLRQTPRQSVSGER